MHISLFSKNSCLRPEKKEKIERKERKNKISV